VTKRRNLVFSLILFRVDARRFCFFARSTPVSAPITARFEWSLTTPRDQARVFRVHGLRFLIPPSPRRGEGQQNTSSPHVLPARMCFRNVRRFLLVRMIPRVRARVDLRSASVRDRAVRAKFLCFAFTRTRSQRTTRARPSVRSSDAFPGRSATRRALDAFVTARLRATRCFQARFPCERASLAARWHLEKLVTS